VTSPAIEARDLSVGYSGRAVVDGISFDVPVGGLVCLIGTNGSGKSTLLKTLAGLLAPVAGSVMVAGGPPGTQPARVGYLAQRPASSFTLPICAADVVAMGRFASLGLVRRAKAADRALCAEAIERMEVGPFAKRPLLELSGGQQQRTHLAQALARRADVLLLDEPTAGLDPSGRETFARAVADERARGCTVAMATHDLGDAEGADVVVLLAGRIVAIGAPAEVLTDDHLRASFGFTGPH
jgi:ABC-type Mn2+/Zn2+ transport system ATPase subunit